MKKAILVISFIILAFFQGNAFCQSQIDIGQQAVEKARQSLSVMGQKNEEQIMSASSEVVFSKNANDFNMFKGTKWVFKYTGTSVFEHIITFNGAVIIDDYFAYLPFTDESGKMGEMFYLLSGDDDDALAYGLSQPFYVMDFGSTSGFMEESYFFNRINDASVAGKYLALLPTGGQSGPYPLTGVKQITETWYKDADGDKYSPGASLQSVNRPANYYLSSELTAISGDCNDNNAAIHPGATEICGDGKDNNCNGTIDEGCVQNIAPPSLLTGRTSSSTQIVLGWKDNSSNETGFKIERKAGNCSSTTTWKQIAAKPANANTHTVSGVSPNTTYSFRVRAYKGSSNSTYSNCSSAKTGLAGTPPSPTNLRTVSASATKVNLIWNDNSVNETGFRIYRKAGAGAWVLLTKTKANVKSFSDTTAANNLSTTSYQYYVVACNASGNSIPSIPAAVPYRPANLKAAQGTTATSIKLTWTDKSANETGFEICRKSGGCASTSPWAKVATLGANKATWTDTGCTAGSTYAYIIRAYTTSGAILSAYGYSLYSICASAAAGEGGGEPTATESEVTVIGQPGETDPDTGLFLRPRVRLEHPAGAWADVPGAPVLYSERVDLKRVAVPNDSSLWDWGGTAWQFVSADGLVISDEVTLALPGTGAKNETVLALSSMGDWIEIPSTAVTLAGGKPGRKVDIGDIPTPWILVVARPTAKTSSVQPPLSLQLEKLFWTDREEWKSRMQDALSEIDLSEKISEPEDVIVSAAPKRGPVNVIIDLDVAIQVLTSVKLGGWGTLMNNLPAYQNPLPGTELSAFKVYVNGLDRLKAVRKEWLKNRKAWKENYSEVELHFSPGQNLDQAIETALSNYAPWGIDLTLFLLHTRVIDTFDMSVIPPYGQGIFADIPLKNPQENPAIGINIAELAEQGVTANCYLRLYSRKAMEFIWVDYLKDEYLQTFVRWAPMALETAGLVTAFMTGVASGGTFPLLFAANFALADQLINDLQDNYSDKEFSTYLNYEIASTSLSVGSCIIDPIKGQVGVGGTWATIGKTVNAGQMIYAFALLYGVNNNNWFMLKEVRSLTDDTRSYCPKGDCAWWFTGCDQIPPILVVAKLQEKPPGYPVNAYPAQRVRLQAWNLPYKPDTDLHNVYYIGYDCDYAVEMPISKQCYNPTWSGGIADLPFAKYKEKSWFDDVLSTAPAAQSIRMRVPTTVFNQIAVDYELDKSAKLADYDIKIVATAPDDSRAMFSLDEKSSVNGTIDNVDLQVVISGTWNKKPADLSGLSHEYDGNRAEMNGKILQTKLTIELFAKSDKKPRATGEIDFAAKEGIKDIEIYPGSPEKEHLQYAEVSLVPEGENVFGRYYDITKWVVIPGGDPSLIAKYNAGDYGYSQCGTPGACELLIAQVFGSSSVSISRKDHTGTSHLASSDPAFDSDDDCLPPLQRENFCKIGENVLTGSDGDGWDCHPGEHAIVVYENSINAIFDNEKVTGMITRYERVPYAEDGVLKYRDGTMQFTFEGKFTRIFEY